MKVLIVGAGAREHALAWKLSREGSDVVVAPGNAGIARDFPCAEARDVNAWFALAHDGAFDVVVVGPEQPLVDGLVDMLSTIGGLHVFGPTRAAARLEGSKAFMKEVARAAGAKTADFVVVRSSDEAKEFLQARRARGVGVVVKADGLCAGKGVVVCGDVDEAAVALADFLGETGRAPRFGDASRTVVVEDLLIGDEVSMFFICSATRTTYMGAARDHKRLLDGDRGPNTGGMGAVGPLTQAQGITQTLIDDVAARIVAPVLDEMNARGAPFHGVLFCGLMVHNGQASLLEFNVRFGDPECEVLAQASTFDWMPMLRGEPFVPTFQKAAAVVLAAAGYPDAPVSGAAISGVDVGCAEDEVNVFFAGVSTQDARLLTAGGRVAVVTARGATFDEAIDTALARAASVRFDGKQLRRDIGASVRENAKGRP